MKNRISLRLHMKILNTKKVDTLSQCIYASMFCQKIKDKEELTKENCLECLKKRDKDYYRNLGWMHQSLVTEIKRSILKLRKELKKPSD